MLANKFWEALMKTNIWLSAVTYQCICGMLIIILLLRVQMHCICLGRDYDTLYNVFTHLHRLLVTPFGEHRVVEQLQFTSYSCFMWVGGGGMFPELCPLKCWPAWRSKWSVARKGPKAVYASHGASGKWDQTVMLPWYSFLWVDCKVLIQLLLLFCIIAVPRGPDLDWHPIVRYAVHCNSLE